MKLLHLLTIATVLAAPFALHASSITYSDSFIGSGSLGDIDFNNALVTFTATANPSDLINEGGGIYALSAPVTFSIAGGASGTFTDSIQVFVNQSSNLAGFGDNTNDLALLYTDNPAFASYELGVIAPTEGSTIFNSYTASLGEAVYGTNDGGFDLTSVSNSTFAATADAPAVPEPASLALLGTGLLGVVGLMRQKLAAA